MAAGPGAEAVARRFDREQEQGRTWMEAWSLAPRILLEALHFLGMYMSTYSPASFCILATRNVSETKRF